MDGNGTDNDFYGFMTVGDTDFWRKTGEDSAVEITEGASFPLSSKRGHIIVGTPKPVQKKGPTGETYWAPDWSAVLNTPV